jgi:hypothetical protein
MRFLKPPSAFILHVSLAFSYDFCQCASRDALESKGLVGVNDGDAKTHHSDSQTDAYPFPPTGRVSVACTLTKINAEIPCEALDAKAVCEYSENLG